MREGPSSAVLAGAVGWAPVASSWRDGVLLAPSIPVHRGRLTGVASQQVPERLEFTVPEYADGRSWVPREDTAHPLARFGQVIVASIQVTAAVSGITITRLGVYRVHAWHHDDVAHEVRVTALGILKRPQEARFTTPEAPRAGGTLASEFRRLMSAGIPVHIDPALVDRPCPQSFQWPQDRLDALYEIADAWPARIHTDQWGTVQLLPPLPAVPTPVLTLTDGQAGTLIAAPTDDSREGQPNQVVVTGAAADAQALDPVRAVAEITEGDMAVTADGTGYGPVTTYFSSPLLENASQALAAARTVLARESRASVVRTVQCAPDPRVDLDDPVAVRRDGRTEWGWVVSYELPWTIHDGDMRVDVGVAP